MAPPVLPSTAGEIGGGTCPSLYRDRAVAEGTMGGSVAYGVDGSGGGVVVTVGFRDMVCAIAGTGDASSRTTTIVLGVPVHDADDMAGVGVGDADG